MKYKGAIGFLVARVVPLSIVMNIVITESEIYGDERLASPKK